MVDRVVVATANAHKLGEIAAILGGVPALAAVPLDLVPMSDLGVAPPVEDGATFAANALLKARACAAATGAPSLADDSGLEVEALGGDPGVRSARYAGEPTDDAANNRLVLSRLAEAGATAPADRRAAFVCAVAFVLPDGTEHVVEGRMEGYLAAGPRGPHGFGYDPLFVADATVDGRTNGELLPAEKDAISHRGAALRAIAPVLADRLSR